MPFPPVINVANLPGAGGFRIEGVAFNDGTGWAVTGPGDSDGDGFDDVVVGAPFVDHPGAYNSGAVYVVFGRDLSVGVNLTFRDRNDELWQLPLVGDDANANVGQHVASLGDLDGDGLHEFAANSDPFRATYASYDHGIDLHMVGAVVWGKPKTDPPPVAHVLLSETSPVSYLYGYSYFTDTNGEHAFGDGFHKACGGFCVGIYGEYGGGSEGDLFLTQVEPDIQSPKTHEVVLSLDRQLGPDLIVPIAIRGDAPNDGFGRSSAALTDYNGDGMVDLAMGAPFNDAGGSNAGAAYIVFGQANLVDMDVTGLASRPTEGLVIIGEDAGDLAGYDVASCGDFNGDGFSDLIIGARRNGEGGVDAGAAYVIFGRPGPGATIDLGNLGANGFKIVGEDGGDRAGLSVSGAGDVNGDGYADVIVGAPSAGPNAGRAYVIFGRATVPGPIDLGNLGADGFRIDAEYSNAELGRSVASAGDMNGDGYDDILVGAPFAFLYGIGSGGAAYVIYGRPTSASTVNSAGSDVLAGTATDDLIDASLGGDDSANGGAGDDGFYFGAAFTPADRVDGGNGRNDQVGLEGNYTGANALLLNATTLDRIEVLAVLPGFDYDITTVDANVPSGVVLSLFGGNLSPDDNLTFDGSAETNGSFKAFGGQGIDLITTGAGDDGIYFGPGKFDPRVDRVDGGTGANDQLALDGDYTLTLDGTAIVNIDVVVLLRGVTGDLADYNLTLADSLIGSGQTMTIWGTPLETVLTVDGSAETDGMIRMFGGTLGDSLTGGANADWFWGGLGGDRMTGGAGADTFMYENAAQSSGASWDTLTGFNDSTDRIDLPFAVSGFSAPVSGTLNAATLAASLVAAFSALTANQAGVFTATGGDLNGRAFLVVDANSTPGYQSAGDYLIEVIAPTTPIDQIAIFV